MINNNDSTNRSGIRERRGVAAVIGGVILAAILLTTVLVYFITILNNEKAKTSYELQSSQDNQAKNAEKLSVIRDHDLTATNNIRIHTANEGSLSSVVSKVLLYCISAGCASPDPIISSPSITLNAAEVDLRDVGPVTNNLTYRIDVISERGNIVSAQECTVDTTAKICNNDSTGNGSPDFLLAASPASLVIEIGKSGSSTITVTSLNGFSSAVALSISPAITGVTPTFAPTSLRPPAGGSQTSTLTIVVSSNAAPGTYAMTITGTSGTITHLQGFSLTILNLSGAVTTGIIQGTGSYQLDFKSFGAIYPTLQDRDSVQQQGWKVQASKVVGYPGFTLKQGLPTIIVERLRNLDSSQQNMVLDKGTTMVVNPGGTPGTGPASNYLCKRNGESVTGYDGTQVLPYTDPNSPFDTNMQALYFCSTSQGGGVANWSPDAKFGYVNPIFMIARATFQNSNVYYGQTIPYQSFTMSPQLTDWYVCLKASDVTISTGNNCVNPTQADPAPAQPYKYRGNPGETVYVHFNQGGFGTGPYHLDWIYPDGTHSTITYTTTAKGNLQFTVPTTMADGTTNIARNQYYILRISDSYISDGGSHVNFMTFQVT